MKKFYKILQIFLLIKVFSYIYYQDSHWIFQQDGATPHTALSIHQYIEEKQITVIP